MKSVKVRIRNTELELGVDDPFRLESLAQKCDQRIAEVTRGLGTHVSDLKAALVTTIMMEDQLETLAKKVEASSINYKLEAENTKAEMEQLKKNLSQTVSQLCDYLDHLADQIAKR
jgi:cell division protein ZapA (FtsZ GTPase activity inhibitor)